MGRELGAYLSAVSPASQIFRGLYPHPESVLVGVFLLALGCLVFVLSLRRFRLPSASAAPPSVTDYRRTITGKWRIVLVLGGAAGLMLHGYLVARLATGHYDPAYPPLMGLAFSSMGVAVFGLDLVGGGGPWRFRLPWQELLFLGTVGLAFVLLNARDLTHWYYSAIGDEYAFFQYAEGIAQQGRTANLFSQEGVYGKFPVLSSAYQAQVMALFGLDNFGWKMSSVLAIVAAIPPFYFLLKAIHGLRAAVLATLFLVSSHYLFAYAHTGYDNIYALFPAMLAFALFFGGRHSSSYGMLFASGAAAGLGFYTYYSSRVAIVILLAYLIISRNPRRNIGPAAAIVLGFVLAVAPLVAVSGDTVITKMFAESAFGYSPAVVGDVATRLRSNLIYAVLAFNYNPDSVQHYVSGSLADPVVAVLSVLGLGWSLSRLGQGSYRFLVLWYAVAMAATGLASPYPGVSISREHFVLPAMAALAGVAADGTLAAVVEAWRRRVAVIAAYGLGAIAVVAVLFLNVDRFWCETPRRLVLTPEAVAIGAALSAECSQPDHNAIIIARQPKPLLAPALASYRLGDREPTLLSFDQAVSKEDYVAEACIVLAEPDNPGATAVLASLRDRFPDRVASAVYDTSGRTKVLLLH